LTERPQLPDRCEVLIVGAGPTGLSLAIELGRRGVRTVVVEQNDRVGYQPRAKLTNVRSIEHLRRWGIADRLRAASPFPTDYPVTVIFATRMFGYPLARFENAFNGGKKRNELYSEPAQYIPQYLVEAVLRATAEALASVTLAFSTRLESAAETSNGVVAELSEVETGGKQRIDAMFLIGADGPRSLVRHLIGARMERNHAYSQNLNVVMNIPCGPTTRNRHRVLAVEWREPGNSASARFAGPLGFQHAGNRRGRTRRRRRATAPGSSSRMPSRMYQSWRAIPG
jgi:2-polyprenyl-6-methoxyphenol hydroxylase-like FAD-dependent oxidoreductase